MRKLLPVAFAGVLILLSLPSCTKWDCCGNVYYNYVCFIGHDTTYVNINGSASNINTMVADSLNFYLGNGYECSDNRYTEPWQAAVGCVGGLANIRRAKASGQECIGASYGHACGSSGDMCGA